jgi:hypothetical protein
MTCPRETREDGIETGELLGAREWVSYPEILGFSFESEVIEGVQYRALYWLPDGAHYCDCTVLGAGVDEDEIGRLLRSKGLEEADPNDSEHLISQRSENGE